MKRMVSALKIELAQYHELLAFSQFGSELDAVSQERLARGARIVELLKQHQQATMSFVDQVLMLFLLKYNFLDAIKAAQVREFCTQFVGYIKLSYPEIYKKIAETADISDEIIKELSVYAKEFSLIYVPINLI
jgi:F-type H+/Na+-transporting ATPase subunit alpha